MKRILLCASVIAVAVTGCASVGDDLDKVMGRSVVEGTPQPEPQRIDCDLIFPGVDNR